MQDGRIVAVESTGVKTRTLWDLTAERKLLELTVAAGNLAFSAASGRVACGTGHAFQVWDLTTGQVVSSGGGGEAQDEMLGLSPDGGRVLLYRRCKFTLWDVTTPTARLLGVIADTGGVLHEFSRDGAWFAAGMPCDFGEKYDIYRTAPFDQALHVPWADFGPVFAANSRTFVAERPLGASALPNWWPARPETGRDLDVVELASQRKLATLPGCEAYTYNADGTRLLVARQPNRIEVWDVPPRRQILVEVGLPIAFAVLLVLFARQCWRGCVF